MTAEELYQTYHDRVMRFFLCRVADLKDAEDLTSEVFLKAIRALPRFDPEKASPSTWLYTISRNTLTDHLRRNPPSEPLPEDAAENDLTEERLMREDTLRELAAALKTLPTEERDIVILRYYNGYPLTEIARLMCLSYGAVKLRHNKALKTLHLALSEEE